MRHLISQNIVSRGFFVGTLFPVFCAVTFLVPLPAFAAAPNHNPVKLLSDDFESGNFSKWDETNMKITSAVVHTGTKAALYVDAPGATRKYFTTSPFREVYFRFWWYMPTGFDGGHAGGKHFWRMGMQGTDQIDTQAQAEPNGFSIIHFTSAGHKFFQNITQLPTGRWFLFEFHSRLNDPGVANGEAKVWIDGVQMLNATNVDLKATRNSFDEFMLTTNYDICSRVCNWYMDDVELWNGCPSGSSCKAGSTPVSLAPPSNLEVVPAP